MTNEAMHTNQEFDELEHLIQRCVDGELSESEQMEFIRSLDLNQCPEAWRLLALEFLECQALQKALADSATFLSLTETHSAETTIAGRPAVHSVDSSQRRRGSLRDAKSLVLVACVLLGFALGFGTDFAGLIRRGELIGSRHAAPNADPSNGSLIESPYNLPGSEFTDAGIPRSSSQSSRNQLVSNPARQPIMQLRIVPPGRHPAEGMLIPIYPDHEIQDIPLVPSSVTLPEEFRRLVRDQGFDIEQRNKTYRVRLQNGSDVIVPAQTIHVRHASQ